MKTLSLICLLISPFLTFTQILINPAAVNHESAKTIFVYRDSDKPTLNELQKVLEENWKFNDIKLMSLEEVGKYVAQENDLFFTINYSYNQSIVIYSDGSDLSSNYVYFYLVLSQKTGKDFTNIAKANIAISGPTIYDVCKTGKSQEEIIMNQYKESAVYSWNHAYLGTVMNTISHKLIEEGPVYNSKSVGTENVGDLAGKKLYITDAVNVHQNLLNGKEKKSDQQKAIDKAYDYEFEIVSNEQVNKLVTAGTEGYVFMFQKDGGGRNAIVLDLSSMEIIYEQRVAGRFNFDAKDISQLNKAIKKASR